MSGELRRIEKELTVSISAIKNFGSYYDKILIPELGCYIALTVSEYKVKIYAKEAQLTSDNLPTNNK